MSGRGEVGIQWKYAAERVATALRFPEPTYDSEIERYSLLCPYPPQYRLESSLSFRKGTLVEWTFLNWDRDQSSDNDNSWAFTDDYFAWL
jgi:hypothetical protein